MADHAVAALLVMAGICLLAAVRHLSNGLWRPIDKANLLFGLMCCFAVGVAWTLAQLYRSESIAQYAPLLKWNIFFSLAFFLFMPWFTESVTSQHSPRWLIALTLAIAVLMVMNLYMPFGLQLASIDRIETRPMLWGESIANPVGRVALPFWFGISACLLVLVHALIRFWLGWRRERSVTSVLMFLAACIFLLACIDGILVRAQVLDFVHLGPLGFFLMVIAMSLTLSFRSRHSLLVSEQRFRALVEQSPFGIEALADDGRTVQVNPAWKRLWGEKDERLRPVIERAFLGHTGESGPMPRQPGNRWIRSFVYPIKDSSGTIRNVIVMHEDVTDEKRADDAARAATAELRQVTRAVLQQERLRALGQMAGGIAHDINNAISPASMYVETLLEQEKS